MKEIPLYILLYNNSRKMHGVPMHRKSRKGKKHVTRCEALECVGALIDYSYGTFDR